MLNIAIGLVGFSLLQILLYGTGFIFMIGFVFMALTRKKKYDDEDITD